MSDQAERPSVLGIDPGLDGAVAVILPARAEAHVTPTIPAAGGRAAAARRRRHARPARAPPDHAGRDRGLADAPAMAEFARRLQAEDRHAAAGP